MIIYLGVKKIAPLAQMVEHMTFNHGVRSSTLRWSTKKPRPVGRGFLFSLTDKAPGRDFLFKHCRRRIKSDKSFQLVYCRALNIALTTELKNTHFQIL